MCHAKRHRRLVIPSDHEMWLFGHTCMLYNDFAREFLLNICSYYISQQKRKDAWVFGKRLLSWFDFVCPLIMNSSAELDFAKLWFYTQNKHTYCTCVISEMKPNLLVHLLLNCGSKQQQITNVNKTSVSWLFCILCNFFAHRAKRDAIEQAVFVCFVFTAGNDATSVKYPVRLP